jgi:succinoglycan biosynthesis protein ExoA
MDESFPFVTIIIPMRNEADHIRSCLEAVLAQDYPAEHMEILVIDGRSTDHSRGVVARYAQLHPNLRLLDNPRQITPSAFNIGVQHAQGQIVSLVSAHTILVPDYIRQCVAALHQSGADGVGGVMHAIGTRYIGKAVALALSSRFGAGDSKYHYAREAAFVDTVPLAAYRREVFDRVGLFDEALIRNQDFEFNYRIRQSGGRLFLAPAICFYYTPRSSLGALWQQYFQYGRWKVRTLQKHPESLRWRQAVAPLFVGACFGSLLLGLLWPPARWLFASIAGCYLLANLVASTIAASRGGWRYLPILPIVFATIHFAWGLGFLYGIARIPLAPRN